MDNSRHDSCLCVSQHGLQQNLESRRQGPPFGCFVASAFVQEPMGAMPIMLAPSEQLHFGNCPRTSGNRTRTLVVTLQLCRETLIADKVRKSQDCKHGAQID